MTIISVKDATGAAQDIQAPLAPGRADAAASKPVVLSTEDKAAVDAVATALGAPADAAASTDTAAVGLLALVKRVLQGITTGLSSLAALVEKLPATLGVKAATASLSVVHAQGALADRSGTITAGGTAQQLAAANAARLGLLVQNLSTGDLWLNMLGTATASQPSLLLAAGAYWESPVGFGAVGAVSIFGATTGQAFSAKEW